MSEETTEKASGSDNLNSLVSHYPQCATVEMDDGRIWTVTKRYVRWNYGLSLMEESNEDVCDDSKWTECAEIKDD